MHAQIRLFFTELSGQNYKIDIGALIPPVENTTATADGRRFLADLFDDSDGKVITFLPGTVPEGDNTAAQGAALLGLVLHAGEGENNAESKDDFRNLLECMVENKCLVEPVPSNFLQCNVIGDDLQVTPVCFDQFSAVIANLEDSERQVGNCFIDTIGHTDSSSAGVPTAFKLDAYTEKEHREIASCLTRKLLIEGPELGLMSILNGFSELWDIVMFIQDVIEKGIDIPGGETMSTFVSGQLSCWDLSSII